MERDGGRVRDSLAQLKEQLCSEGISFEFKDLVELHKLSLNFLQQIWKLLENEFSKDKHKIHPKLFTKTRIKLNSLLSKVNHLEREENNFSTGKTYYTTDTRGLSDYYQQSGALNYVVESREPLEPVKEELHSTNYHQEQPLDGSLYVQGDPTEVSQYHLSSNSSSCEEDDSGNPEDISFNWNSRFLELLRLHNSEDIDKYEKMSTLALEFVKAADTFTQTLVGEQHIQNDLKKIKALDVGGIAGGTKYEVHGLFFKYPKDTKETSSWLYGANSPDDISAAKSSNHDFKGLSHFLVAELKQRSVSIEEVPQIQVPLCALIDYQGFRLTVMTKLPINKDTLVYGSSDGGKSIKASPYVHKALIGIGKELNLKPHIVTTHHETVALCGDIEIHAVQMNNNEIYYGLDMARIFPPVAWYSGAPPGSFLYRMMRPEAVRSNPVDLSSDALTRWQTDPQKDQLDQEVLEATHLVITKIQQFAKEFSRTEVYLDRGTGISQTIPNSETIRMIRAAFLNEIGDKIEFLSDLHRNGINYRYMGLILLNLSESQHMNIKVTDSFSLTQIEFVASLMFLRSLKNEWRKRIQQHIRAEPQLVYTVSLSKTLEILNDVYNLHPKSFKTTDIINQIYTSCIHRNFGEGIMEAEELIKLKNVFLERSSKFKSPFFLNWVVRTFCFDCGIVLNASCVECLSTFEPFEFSNEAISSFQSRIKPLSILDYYTASYFLEKAKVIDVIATKIILYKSAKQKFLNCYGLDLPFLSEKLAQCSLACQRFNQKDSANLINIKAILENILTRTNFGSEGFFSLYLDICSSFIWVNLQRIQNKNQRAEIFWAELINELFSLSVYDERKHLFLHFFGEDILNELGVKDNQVYKINLCNLTDVLSTELLNFNKKYKVTRRTLLEWILIYPNVFSSFVQDACSWDLPKIYKHVFFGILLSKSRKVPKYLHNNKQLDQIQNNEALTMKTFLSQFIGNNTRIKSELLNSVTSFPLIATILTDFSSYKLLRKRKVVDDILKKIVKKCAYKQPLNFLMEMQNEIINPVVSLPYTYLDTFGDKVKQADPPKIHRVKVENFWKKENSIEKTGVFGSLISLLKNHNYDLNNHLEPPIFNAVKKQNIFTIMLLIAHKANFRITDQYGNGVLHVACENEKPNFEMIKLLIKHKADISAANKLNRTPLHICCSLGHMTLVRYLCDLGANPEVKDINGITCMMEANRNNKSDVVSYLINKVAALNAIYNDLMNGNISLFRKMLIDRQITPHFKFEHRKPHYIISYACKLGNMDVVKILIEMNASVNVTEDDGRSPLHYAAEEGHIDILELLLSQNVNVDARTEEGETALHLSSNKNITSLLIEKKAAINIETKDGYTPLHYAQNSPDITELLLQKGARESQISEGNIKFSRRRHKIIEEFLESEFVYVNGLETLDKFNVDLKKKNLHHLPQATNLVSLLDRIPTMLKFSKLSLESYKTRILSWNSKGGRIGDIFLSYFAFLKTNSIFMESTKDALVSLNELTTLSLSSNSPLTEFQNVLHNARSNPKSHGMDVSTIISATSQRIPQYINITKELLQYTEQSHIDYSDLLRTVEVLKGVQASIQQSLQTRDGFKKMMILNSKLSSSEREILTPQRKLLSIFTVNGLGDSIIASQKTLTMKPNQLFPIFIILFSDALLFTKSKKKLNDLKLEELEDNNDVMLKVVGRLPIDHTDLIDLEGYGIDNAFAIRNVKEDIQWVFGAKSKQLKMELLSRIDETIAHHFEYYTLSYQSPDESSISKTGVLKKLDEEGLKVCHIHLTKTSFHWFLPEKTNPNHAGCNIIVLAKVNVSLDFQSLQPVIQITTASSKDLKFLAESWHEALNWLNAIRNIMRSDSLLNSK